MNLTFLSRIVGSRRLPRWLVIIGAVIIAAPLLLIGFFALLAAIASWIDGADLQTAIGATLISIASYGAAGYCLVKAWRYEKRESVSEAEAARQPWKARPEWEGGVVKDKGESGSTKLLFFALICNVLGWPVAINTTSDFLQNDDGSALIFAIWAFPALGVWLGGKWVYQFLRRRKYGESAFDMDPFPGEIGGGVRGTVQTKMRSGDAPENGFAVKLGCYRREVYYRRDSDGDRHRKIRLHEQWSQSQTVQPKTDSGGRLSVPVDFHVPPGMDASTPTKRRERLLWRLDVKADVPGIDYEAQFEIPVFDTSDTGRGQAEDPSRPLTEGGNKAQLADRTDAAEVSTNGNEAIPAFASSPSSSEVSAPEEPVADEHKAESVAAGPKPWTYRDEWADGHIEADKDTGSLIFLTLFAIGWNAFSWPLAYYEFFGGGLGGEGNSNLVVIFPIIGIVVAAIAIYKGIRRAKYGETVFEMDEVPGVLGGAISGIITAGMRSEEAPSEGFQVLLSCFERRVTRDSDGDKDVDLNLYWRDEKRVQPRSSSQGEPAQVPVYFELPDDQPESTPVKKSNRMLWRLDVKADVPGVDYAAQMEVPVFDVPERATQQKPEASTEKEEVFWEMDGGDKVSSLQREDAASASSENPYAEHEITEQFTEPVSKGISMERTPSGGVEFYFGPARKKGTALFLTLLTVILGGVAWFVMQSGSGMGAILVGLIVGLFPLLTAYLSVRYWTYTSSLRIENGQVTVREGPFGRGTPTTFSCAKLEEVKVAAEGGSGKASYEIRLIRSEDEAQVQEKAEKAAAFMENMGANMNEGARRRMERAQENTQHLVAARWLSNHEEADWIAAQIREQVSEQARWG